MCRSYFTFAQLWYHGMVVLAWFGGMILLKSEISVGFSSKVRPESFSYITILEIKLNWWTFIKNQFSRRIKEVIHCELNLASHQKHYRCPREPHG